MATTDLYTIAGSLNPTRHAIRFRGGNTDEGVQVDALAAAIVAGNHTKGTITAWIMVPDNTGTYTIFGAGDANVAEYMFFRVEAGTLQFWVQDGGATRVDTNTTAKVIKPHTWHHVALVQDGEKPKFYVDGTEYARTDTTATELGQWFDDTDGIDGAHIGAADSIGGDAALTVEFKGYISDLKVWSGTASTAALTATQVKDDMRGVSNTTSLLAWYNMDGNVVNQANSGTYDGTKVATAIYCQANEFASRLTFNPSITLVTADHPRIAMNEHMGFAIVTDAA